MKNKVFIVLNSVLLFIFISCNQKIDIQYYDTGEVYKIEKRINDHKTYVHTYFKNGKLKQEGMLYNSLRDGNWKMYYSDGVLKTEVIFSENKPVKEIIKHPILLEFKGDPTELKVGYSYQFRILGVGFFTIEKPVKVLGYIRYLEEDNPYLCEITPRKADNDTILIIVNHFNEGIKNDSIFFPIKIVNVEFE